MCIIKVKVSCPHCRSSKVVKNGKKKTGVQNFLCKECSKQFQNEYYYQGADPKVKSAIEISVINGSGVKDCTKQHHVSHQTVQKVIETEGKKIIKNKIEALKNNQQVTKKQHYHKIIIDELYSFVGSKGNPEYSGWIFYAYAPETKEILGFTMGRRNT